MARAALSVSSFLCLFLLGAVGARGDAPTILPDGFFDGLPARHIGPIGNRVPAVTGVPGDSKTYYAGAASGGIWKTEDAGTSWRPIFDDQDVSAIGALAVAPSDRNVVWAGTGETFIRANISIGNGIYRSTDSGRTWNHQGLEKTGRIGRIAIDPRDPDVVFAAALGHVYGPQEDRGVYRTKDGGATWEKVLFVDEHTGAIDVVIDPNNPRILFAAMWQIRVWTSGRESGGPGSGLWRSADGGDTWTELTGSGLPTKPWGKIGLAMSAADSDRIYALIETSTNADFAPSDPFQGVLWRSDDGGGRWSMISADNNLVQRPLYYTRAAVSPDDADEIHFLAVRHTRSIDGGKTIQGVNAGWDHHDMWIDPEDPDRMIVGHDGGVSISVNRGATWAKPQLPIAQLYHVATDRRIPYTVFGNRQDGPSTSGPSNSLDGGTIPIGAWRSVGGCEVGFTLPSPVDDDLVWTGCYDGILDLHNRRTGHSRNVMVWPSAAESWSGEDLKYRFQWTFPVALSPHDPNRVYAGSQFVHRTVDQGQSWQVISPDLTTDDPELKRRTGGLTLDDAGPTLAPTVFALVESPLRAGEIWAGTNDGQLQVTRDAGEGWQNVTAALPDLPPLGTVSNIEPSRHDADHVYVTVDRHQEGDTATYVFKTEDGGRSWRDLRGDLPQDLFAYAHCVREDPTRPGLLYLGTENAVWVSWNDGTNWHRLRAGLPPAPVHWIEIQPDFNDLVIATYGRGFWILDDLTALQQLDQSTLDAETYLFAPRPAYRFRFKEAPMQQPGDPAAGTNPEYGASFHVWLKDDVEGDVALEIVDADGESVRDLGDEAPSSAGLHRLHWDLSTDLTTQVRLRTQPDENPLVPVPERGWRGLADGGRMVLLSPPGTYTVRYTVGDTVYEQPLTVLKDPNSEGTDEDLAAQFALLDPLYDMIDRAAVLLNEIEWLRRQTRELGERLDAMPSEGDDDEPSESVTKAKEAADALVESLTEIEGVFFDLRLTGAGQDSLRWKRLLYAKMTYLGWFVGQSDFRPTDSQQAVFRELQTALEMQVQALDEVRSTAVPAFNQQLRDAGFDGLLVRLQ